ncbi:unnamed protein product [Cladocopium goreaui]|uniref:Uncharacterized protein n=1 Tax=Cladocopium goreaui TaxID=2562237 RepID=A0A9P1FFT3_9DINO|nr:unnamed protein product [Cladocopium goreaui]
MAGPLRKKRKAATEGFSTARLPDQLSDDEISDVSDTPRKAPAPAPPSAAEPPMAVPSVQGFARWNLERCPEVLEAIRENGRKWARPLRVFSMYTGWGTAEMVTHAVGRELQRLGIDMEFEVAWICESNREKCKYLASAFQDVGYIFTDASEVADGYAHDYRTGQKFLVPTDLDLGFVGYPCVDLSSLNVGQGQFMDTSTATGKGYANMLKLVDRCDDHLLFLGVENSGNMWRKRKQDAFRRPIEIQDAAFRQRGFATASHRVSSYEFGPPQSRQRSWSLYFKSRSADGNASRIFLSFKCNVMPISQILAEGHKTDRSWPMRPKGGTKWMGQFEQLSSCLDQARLQRKISEVVTRKLPLTSRELHVVALAAYQLEGRGVDLEKNTVVIQVDQNFGRSHRADARVAPCIIPKGKYVVTGSHWRLLGTREKCFLQGVGPAEIEGYGMEKCLSPVQLSDMAGNAFTAQICLAAFLTALAVVDPPWGAIENPEISNI